MKSKHGFSTPPVYAIKKAKGEEYAIYHKYLAGRIADEAGQRYDHLVAWTRCKLSFVIMTSAMICIRISHSLKADCDYVEDLKIETLMDLPNFIN